MSVSVAANNREQRQPSEPEANIIRTVETDGRALSASQPSKDVVDEAGDESFPASDAPSWSPTVIGAPSHE